jgi:hypothetical protein
VRLRRRRSIHDTRFFESFMDPEEDATRVLILRDSRQQCDIPAAPEGIKLLKGHKRAREESVLLQAAATLEASHDVCPGGMIPQFSPLIPRLEGVYEQGMLPCALCCKDPPGSLTNLVDRPLLPPHGLRSFVTHAKLLDIAPRSGAGLSFGRDRDTPRHLRLRVAFRRLCQTLQEASDQMFLQR